MKRFARYALWSLLAVFALVAIGVGAAWAPDRSVEELSARWAPAPSRFVPIDGMDVHLRDEGRRDDPVPIVLLHGTSASLHTWDGWVRALEDRRRVVRLDLPGFGLTGPTPDGAYTVARYVRFLIATFDALGLTQVVLVGNSFGGALAWETALAAPERVDRLILVDAGGYAYQPTSVPIAFRLAQIPALRPILERLLPRSVIESSVRNVYGDPAKVTPALIDRYYELTLREGNRRAVVERFRQAQPGEHVDRIREIRQPTLIVWGDEDRLIPPELGERFHRDIAGSELVRLPGLGHVPHEEDPRASVAPVERFLGLR